MTIADIAVVIGALIATAGLVRFFFVYRRRVLDFFYRLFFLSSSSQHK